MKYHGKCKTFRIDRNKKTGMKNFQKKFPLLTVGNSFSKTEQILNG